MLLSVVASTCISGATACGAEDSSRADEAAKHVGTYRASGEGGDGALLEGTVRIVDGCFLVEDKGGPRYLPYFPDDEVRRNGEGLEYSGASYGDGAAIALGGGVSGSPEPMPANCSGLNGLVRWTVGQGG